MSSKKNTSNKITRLRIGRQVVFLDDNRTVVVTNLVTERGITIYGMKNVKTNQLEICSHNALTERIKNNTAIFGN